MLEHNSSAGHLICETKLFQKSGKPRRSPRQDPLLPCLCVRAMPVYYRFISEQALHSQHRWFTHGIPLYQDTAVNGIACTVDTFNDQAPARYGCQGELGNTELSSLVAGSAQPDSDRYSCRHLSERIETCIVCILCISNDLPCHPVSGTRQPWNQ